MPHKRADLRRALARLAYGADRRRIAHVSPAFTSVRALMSGRALDEQLAALVERFVNAWEHNDIDGVVSLLADDARMVMPPLPSW